MKKFLLFIAIVYSISVNAQDTMQMDKREGTIIVNKDPRLEVLAKKELELNSSVSIVKSCKGFRLMVLNTNNRNLAMTVRTALLQRYPDQKVYMSFQPPYIKLKFGNFLQRNDATKIKAELIKNKIVTGSIYIIPEIIEVKPDKTN